MAALVTAACTCNCGPHFAQPRKLTSLKTFRDIAERRARNVIWEFELALRRLSTRRATREPVPTTQLDWREALDLFVRHASGRRPAAVYLDPPYSKLQYSRYYHVLNVLISYDYPTIQGVGRYPPLRDRFSSRFEHRPRTAMREFEEIFRACQDQGLTLLVSYSDSGLVPIDDLTQAMSRAFGSVEVFSEHIRHHSQGVRLSKRPGLVTEYILVGVPGRA
jgi:hypothetical protein